MKARWWVRAAACSADVVVASFGWVSRAALATSLACYITGCSQGAAVHTSSVQRSVPVEAAYLLPPPGGPSIIHVVERGHSNGIQQEISLATDSVVSGQNYFRVRLLGRLDSRDAGKGSLASRPIAWTNVNSEIRSAFRNVSMTKSPYFVQNRYGPFGYAVGRSGDDLCFYGWQDLRSRPALIGDKGSIDIRVRVCETGASERRLLAVMYGYTVNAYLSDSNWDPYGTPPAVADSVGAAGSEVYPLGETQFQTVLPEQQTTVVPPRRVKPRRQAVIAPPVDEAPTGPVVPSPPAVAGAPTVPLPTPAVD